jgi:hypothetical protein
VQKHTQQTDKEIKENTSLDYDKNTTHIHKDAPPSSTDNKYSTVAPLSVASILQNNKTHKEEERERRKKKQDENA